MNFQFILLCLLIFGVTGSVYAEQVSVTSSGKVVGISRGEPQRIDFLLLQSLEIVRKSFVLVKDRGANVLYARVKQWDAARKTLSLEAVRRYGDNSAISLSRNYDLVLRVEERGGPKAENRVEPSKVEARPEVRQETRPETRTETAKTSPPAQISFQARSTRRWFIDLSYGDPISQQPLNFHAGYHLFSFLSTYAAYGYYAEKAPGGSAYMSDAVWGVRALMPDRELSPFLSASINYVKIYSQQLDGERTYFDGFAGIGFGGEWQGPTGLRAAAAFTFFIGRDLPDETWAPSALSFRFGWAL